MVQYTLIVLLVVCLFLLVWVLMKLSKGSQLDPEISNNQNKIRDDLSRLQGLTTEELARNRKEGTEVAQNNREELQKSLSQNRQELSDKLQQFEKTFGEKVNDFNELQRVKFDDLIRKQEHIRKDTEERLSKVRETVDQKLTSIQKGNEERLEKMRQTVDEKLQETLDKRLSESFKLVGERLEAVQKGLGDMQQLANGVGDLKKVLSNVKTRGALGEIQLGNILEQIMAPEQYQANVKTKLGSDAHVEFAIKLPGKGDSDSVYLPIDAKFPQEDFLRLQDAYDNGDLELIEQSTKGLNQQIKISAKTIKEKYIDPPNTTDFGILFLPIEGLYAEVVRQPDMVESLQRDFKIIIAGPTTLAAMLNSLQMGFKTLAIQKRSSEVWETLSAVKTEFKKFGGVLEKAQKKLEGASKDLENLSGTRSRAIERKLRDVQELPQIEEQDRLMGDEYSSND